MPRLSFSYNIMIRRVFHMSIMLVVSLVSLIRFLSSVFVIIYILIKPSYLGAKHFGCRKSLHIRDGKSSEGKHRARRSGVYCLNVLNVPTQDEIARVPSRQQIQKCLRLWGQRKQDGPVLLSLCRRQWQHICPGVSFFGPKFWEYSDGGFNDSS